MAFAIMAALRTPNRLIAAGDTFFAAYLVFISFALRMTADGLRQRASVEDEGMVLVVLIVLAAISICCGSVIAILHQTHGRLTIALLLALASAPLGWFTLHIVAAFHYAYLYYRDPASGCSDGARPAPLLFPGARDPTAWDFVYYALVVGMTAQVSDVQVTDVKLRRATAGHGVVSFFFNTVLIAMAVNAVVTVAT